MAIKSPGGYVLIDLKGVDIGTSATTIEDPEILYVFNEIREARLCKPVYITNFLADGDAVFLPVLLNDSIPLDDKLYASWGGSSNNIEITLSGLPSSITVQMP